MHLIIVHICLVVSVITDQHKDCEFFTITKSQVLFPKSHDLSISQSQGNFRSRAEVDSGILDQYNDHQEHLDSYERSVRDRKPDSMNHLVQYDEH